MTPIYTINYRPLISHPIGKAAFAFLLLLSGLLALMMANHVRLYQGFPPIEFFLPPFINLVLLSYNETLNISRGQCVLEKSILGFRLKCMEFWSVEIEQDRKYSTFVFQNTKGRYVSNIVLSSEDAKRQIQVILSMIHKPV